MNPKGRNPLLLLSTMIVLSSALQGCGILDEGTPETAKIVVTGGSAETFQLVTTTDFDVILDEAGENREGLAQPMTTRVLIDGEERYNSTSTLKDLALEFNWAYR